MWQPCFSESCCFFIPHCVRVCVCVSLQSSDDEEGLGKGRGRHIFVNKTEMPSWSETLDSFRTARESWDLLHSHDALETGKNCLSSLRVFLI